MRQYLFLVCRAQSINHNWFEQFNTQNHEMSYGSEIVKPWRYIECTIWTAHAAVKGKERTCPRSYFSGRPSFYHVLFVHSKTSGTRNCWQKTEELTLHMGATKIPPSQYSGFFLCNSRTIAPPMDSPIRYLIFPLFSLFSGYHPQQKEKTQTI